MHFLELCLGLSANPMNLLDFKNNKNTLAFFALYTGSNFAHEK